MNDDPTTEELQDAQIRREQAEREGARRAIEDDAAEQHERRAEKAAYLRDKLGARALSEEEAERSD